MPKQNSLTEEKNPVFQEVARFRAIAFDGLLKPYDMTMSQGWVLVHLWREDGLRQSDLAERMDVATVTISKLVDGLESRGYVERRAGSVDRRSKNVFRTKRGSELVKVMTKTVFQVDEIANQGIAEEDLALTLSVMTKMRNNLKNAITQK